MIGKYGILSPVSPAEDEKFAVEEALFFLPQITGIPAACVSVLPDDGDTYCISLGKTEAFRNYCEKTGYVLSEHRSDDGFDVCVDGNICYIAGKEPTGTLFGLYEVLKRMFGFCLYSETDFSYECSEIRPEFSSFVFEPSIPIRTIGIYPVYGQNKRYERRMKLWTFCENWVMWGHTFHAVLPNDRYMESHPEWYGKGNNAFIRQYDKGTKKVSGESGEIIESAREGMSDAKSLCLTNEEVKAEFTKNLIQILIDKPEGKLVMLGQEDNQCVCMCKRCEELRAKYNGIESAVVLTFMNDVVKKVNAWVRENQPGRKLKFVTFAYMYTLFPPVKKTENGFELYDELKLEDNLYLLIAPNGANSSQSYFDEKNTICFDDCYSGPHHTRVLDMWEGWHAVTKNTMIWTYNADYVDFLAPFLCWDAFEDNFRHYASYGAEYIFEEGAYPYPITNFTELKLFCAAEMMWDCSRPLRGLIEGFISHYYDDRTGCVLKYFDYLNGHREYLEKTFNRKMIPGLYVDYQILSSGVYWSKDFLETALSIMDNGAPIPECYDKLTTYEWRRIAERVPCEYILLKNYLRELPHETAEKKICLVEQVAFHFGMNKIGEFAPKDMKTYIAEWKAAIADEKL